jgi:hypothetical protein
MTEPAGETQGAKRVHPAVAERARQGLLVHSEKQIPRLRSG